MFDQKYTIACDIIKTFDPLYPPPPANEIVKTLLEASVLCGTVKTQKIIEWAQDYTEQFAKEHHILD